LWKLWKFWISRLDQKVIRNYIIVNTVSLQWKQIIAHRNIKVKLNFKKTKGVRFDTVYVNNVYQKIIKFFVKIKHVLIKIVIR